MADAIRVVLENHAIGMERLVWETSWEMKIDTCKYHHYAQEHLNRLLNHLYISLAERFDSSSKQMMQDSAQ